MAPPGPAPEASSTAAAQVPSLLAPALPGEGVWHATRPSLDREPPVLVTTLRDQPEYPRVYVGLAWIDTKRTDDRAQPGTAGAVGRTAQAAPMEVPAASRARLLATFNSGFKLADSKGGFALGGHTYAPMQNGQATIVGYANGDVDVVDWTGRPDGSRRTCRSRARTCR